MNYLSINEQMIAPHLFLSERPISELLFWEKNKSLSWLKGIFKGSEFKTFQKNYVLEHYKALVSQIMLVYEFVY